MKSWLKPILIILVIGFALSLTGMKCPWDKDDDDDDIITGSSTLQFLGEPVRAIAINPSNPDILYVSIWLSGLYKTTDGGENWTEIIINMVGSKTTYISDIALDPSNPDIVYVIDAGYSKVYKSLDGGETWALFLDNWTMTIEINPTDPDIIYIYHSTYIHKTTNGGAGWSQFDITDGLRAPGMCSCLVINPGNPNILYAGDGSINSSEGIFKSNDGGETWTQINTGFPVSYTVNTIAINPVITTTIYMGSEDGVIYKSINGGVNWAESDTGLNGAEVTSLVIDPSNPNIIYATTLDQGIFKSTDSGANWTAINTGLTNLYIYSLVINPISSNTLYCGQWSGDGGVFKSTDGGANWVFLP